MKFLNKLAADVENQVASCNQVLVDPSRLEALAQTGLTDSGNVEVFDRLARLAAQILQVPLTIVSLVTDEKQFFKGSHGLPPPFNETREVPIDDSICRYTLQNDPIIAADASQHELLRHHPTTQPWGIVAFLAIPMRTDDGHVLGAFCAVDTKVRPWSDQDIQVMRELTASVMTEIKLRSQIQELKAERDLREKFVTTISHDLRNPLNIAKIGVQLISQPEMAQEDRESFSKMVSENIDRADQMIQDLLTASRVRAGEKLAMNTKFDDILMIVKPTVDALERMHKRKFVLAKEESVKGQWDADRIRRIIENLAGNAVKYGDAKLPVTISVSMTEQGVSIAIHNHGQPIPEKELKNLFTLFERAESATGGIQKGWGVGLAIVQTLTEEMNGSIAVVSDANDGTTFTVFIPAN